MTSSYYCAGFIARAGIVVKTAPILKWAKGKEIGDVLRYFRRKGWKVEVIKGGVAESVDAPVSSVGADRRPGSNPGAPTK